MACPTVAGLAALVASINPNLTGKEIKNLILDNVQKRDFYADIASSSGLIDVAKTITKAAETAETCKQPLWSNSVCICFKNGLENSTCHIS